MSTSKKPSSLLGRLAIQLKMITMDQLAEATAEQGRRPDKRLGDILVAQGCLSEGQLTQLMQVQRDVIAKHRAKKAQEAAEHITTQDSQKAIGDSGAERRRRAALPIQDGAAPVAESIPAPESSDAVPEPAPPVVAPQVVDDRDSLDLSMARGQGDPNRLHQLLGDAVSAGASDIHIHAGAPLKMRLHGTLADTGSDLFTSEQAEQLALAALSKGEQEELARTGEIDSCITVDGIGRFRLNAYRQQRGFDAVFRAIPARPPTLEDLGLPNALAKFTNFHQGMVLLTGPSGCGKSATLAALVNMINEERDEHILTVEDPIEYLHPSKRCLVNQRHAGRHTGSFARALRAALREDPDVIVIGELRDLETISLAMTAAETGHFVLATLHTANAVRTINRMIGAFPSNRQDQVRTMLSESLRAVISQRLVPTVEGTSRVPALEVLVINKAISNMIRDEKTVQIRSSIQTGGAHGMYLLEQSLKELVDAGTIDMETALRIAEDKKLLQG